jgi:hypothetical protein
MNKKGAVHDNQLPCERVYNREDPTTAELWQRCCELVKENQKEWTKGFLEIAGSMGWPENHTVVGWTRGFPSSITIPIRIWNAKADELLLKYPLEKVTLNHRSGRQRPERRNIERFRGGYTEAQEMRLPGREWVAVPFNVRGNRPKWLYEHYWPGIKFVL